MAKVIGFVGSPRKGGNTDTLVQAVLAGAADKGAETKIYYLNDLAIKGCQGCEACKDDQACATDDEMQPIYKEIIEADGIVIGSPIYAAYLSGQTKLFMDRWYAFFDRDLVSWLPQGKRFVLVITYGDEGDEVYNSVVVSLGTLVRMTSPELLEILVLSGTEDKDSASRNRDILRRARLLGYRLAGE